MMGSEENCTEMRKFGSIFANTFRTLIIVISFTDSRVKTVIERKT